MGERQLTAICRKRRSSDFNQQPTDFGDTED